MHFSLIRTLVSQALVFGATEVKVTSAPGWVVRPGRKGNSSWRGWRLDDNKGSPDLRFIIPKAFPLSSSFPHNDVLLRFYHLLYKAWLTKEEESYFIVWGLLMWDVPPTKPGWYLEPFMSRLSRAAKVMTQGWQLGMFQSMAQQLSSPPPANRKKSDGLRAWGCKVVRGVGLWVAELPRVWVRAPYGGAQWGVSPPSAPGHLSSLWVT